MITLYPWQQSNHNKLVQILSAGRIALDASETGTGKTYTSLATAKTLNLSPVVICPLSAIGAWRQVAKEAEVELAGVINIEQIRGKKTPWYNQQGLWTLDPKTQILIWDECHKGTGGPKTQTTEVMGRAKAFKFKILAMSATIADDPRKMRALGYLLDLHQFNKGSFYQWCLRNGCYRSEWHSGLDFSKGPAGTEAMRRIYNTIEPRMVRSMIKDLPGFPDNELEPQLITVPEKLLGQVNAAYQQLSDAVLHPDPDAPVIVHKLRARQRSEMAKVPVILEKTMDALNEGKSVVVFLCFHASIDHLLALYKNENISVVSIDGRERSPAKREEARQQFQTDKARVFVAQLDTGGVSISLHHTSTSKYPRVSFICPDYSATHFIQAVGRTHRTGALSKTVQQVLLLAGSVEEQIYRTIQRKKHNLSALQDADFEGEE